MLNRLFFCILLICPLSLLAQNTAPTVINDGSFLLARAKNMYTLAAKSTNKQEQVHYFKQSQSLLHQLLKEHPTHLKKDEIYFFLALTYFKLNNNPYGDSYLAKIVKFGKDDIYIAQSARYLAARNQLLKKPKKVLFYLQKWTQHAKSTNKIAALFQLGSYYKKLKKQSLYIQTFQQLLQLAPKDHPHALIAAFEIGNHYIYQKKYLLALQLFNQIISHSVDRETLLEAIYLQANTYNLLNQKSKAIDSYQRILREPDSIWASYSYIALLDIYYQQKKYSQVLQEITKNKALNQQITHKSTLQKVNLLEAKSLFYLQNYTLARNIFESIAKQNTSSILGFNASFFKLLCDYHLNLNKQFLTAALQFLNTYSKQFHHNAQLNKVRWMLAEYYFSKKEFHQALLLYENTVTKSFDKTSLQHLLYKQIWCNFQLNQIDALQKNITKYKESSPPKENLQQCLFLKAILLKKQQKTLAAKKLFQELLTQKPNVKLAIKIMENLALIYQKNKNYTKLEETCYYLLKQKKQPSIPTNTVIYWLAYAQFQQKKYTLSSETIHLLNKNTTSILPNKFYTLQSYNLFQLKRSRQMYQLIYQTQQLAKKQKITTPIIENQFYFWAAIELMKKQDNAAASYLFQHILQQKKYQSKTYIYYWHNYLKALLALKKYPKIMLLWQEISTFSPAINQIAEMNIIYTKTLIAQKKYEPAKKRLLTILNQQPSLQHKIQFLYLLGNIYQQQQNYRKATHYYGLIINLYQNSPLLKKTLQQIIICYQQLAEDSNSAKYQRILQQKFPAKN